MLKYHFPSCIHTRLYPTLGMRMLNETDPSLFVSKLEYSIGPIRIQKYQANILCGSKLLKNLILISSRYCGSYLSSDSNTKLKRFNSLSPSMAQINGHRTLTHLNNYIYMNDTKTGSEMFISWWAAIEMQDRIDVTKSDHGWLMVEVIRNIFNFAPKTRDSAITLVWRWGFWMNTSSIGLIVLPKTKSDHRIDVTKSNHGGPIVEVIRNIFTFVPKTHNSAITVVWRWGFSVNTSSIGLIVQRWNFYGYLCH